MCVGIGWIFIGLYGSYFVWVYIRIMFIELKDVGTLFRYLYV